MRRSGVGSHATCGRLGLGPGPGSLGFRYRSENSELVRSCLRRVEFKLEDCGLFGKLLMILEQLFLTLNLIRQARTVQSLRLWR